VIARASASKPATTALAASSSCRESGIPDCDSVGDTVTLVISLGRLDVDRRAFLAAAAAVGLAAPELPTWTLSYASSADRDPCGSEWTRSPLSGR
jgi:hypothetical protein